LIVSLWARVCTGIAGYDEVDLNNAHVRPASHAKQFSGSHPMDYLFSCYSLSARQGASNLYPAQNAIMVKRCTKKFDLNW